MSEKHKTIYALVLHLSPGEHIYTNPISDKSFSFRPDHNGDVLVYIGETTMSLKARLSKHKTFTNKFISYCNDEEVNDPHLYPIYAMLAEYQLLGYQFDIIELQSGPGQSEAEWIEHAIKDGHPIQNAAAGSKFTIKGFKPEDTSINGVFKKVNEMHFPKHEKKEPTPEEVAAAREAWVAARKT